MDEGEGMALEGGGGVSLERAHRFVVSFVQP